MAYQGNVLEVVLVRKKSVLNSLRAAQNILKMKYATVVCLLKSKSLAILYDVMLAD